MPESQTQSAPPHRWWRIKPTRLAVLSLLILILFVGIAPIGEVWRIGRVFNDFTEQELPLERQAYELEINALSVGLSTLAYAQTRDPDHLTRIDNSKTNIDRAMKVLKGLSRLDTSGSLREGIEEHLATFLTKGDQVVEASNGMFQLRQSLVDHLDAMESLLDERIEAELRSGGDRRFRQLETALALEADLDAMLKGFGPYLAANENLDKARIEHYHTEILGSLEQWRELVNNEQERQATAAVSESYARLRTSLLAYLEQVRALRDLRDEFVRNQQALDATIDDKLQTRLDQQMVDKQRDLANQARQTLWLQSTLTAAGLAMAIWIAVFLARNEKELKQKQAQLIESDRYKSDFLANMSHEIRTPMNAVLGMARLLGRTDLNDRQQDYLHKIRRSAENLLGIINDILDFSRIEANRLKLENVNFDLDEVLDDVANMAGLRAEEKGLELIYRIHPDVPLKLNGDPLRISQILINLVGNAIKFTESGHVMVSAGVSRDDGHDVTLEFEVRDSGLGMSEAQQNQLFRAFTQADSSTTRRFGGTGLGLTIVRHLVDRMGGQIHLESAPGEGTTFRFTLNLQHVVSQSLNAAVAKVPLKNRHALVVDDIGINREVLVEILHSWDFTVEEAGTAEAALEKEQAATEAGQPFSLILMDWRLPGMDGLAASERILSTDHPERPLVLMVTAYDREDIRKQAWELGIPAVLKKPFTPSTLYNAISAATATGEDPAPSPSPEAGEGLPHFPKARILLVEDNTINLQVVQELLEAAEATVVTAGNGREGVEKVQRASFDAVLMDAQMPEMDGYTATRTLRGDERYESLPIIAMTAHAMAGDREKCLEAGMSDYLAKPIDEFQLFRTLARWLPEDKVARSEEPSDTPPSPETDDDRAVIDFDGALQRIGGKKELFERQLGVFQDEYGQSIQQFRSMIEQGRWQEANDLAHTIKGTAWLLGINGVAEASANLEVRLKQGATAEELEPCLTRFEGELEAACSVITTRLEHDSTCQGHPGDGLNTAEIEGQLGALYRRLARNDLSAHLLVTRVEASLRGSKYNDHTRQLREAVDRLAFDDALRALERLAQSLEIELNDD